MPVFPVIDSTISPEALSQWLPAIYEFDAQPEVKLFRTGINHTYMVRAGAHKAVLRIYSHNWRTREQIGEEVKVLRLARETGLPVSYPLPDKAGTFIQEVVAPEGLRYAMLFSYAEGRKVRNFSLPLCEKLGETMAKFHKVTENQTVERINYNAESLVLKPYEYARRFFTGDNPEMQFIKQAGDMIRRIFAESDQSRLRKGIVHLDIWYDNMGITPGEDFTIFDFDFDFCGNGWLLHDVAYFLMQLRRQEQDMNVYEQKKEAFLKGYRKYNTISQAEMALLPWSGLSIWIFYLGVQCRRFDNWSNVFLSENYLTMFMGMAKDWLAYHGKRIGEESAVD
jgi:Ser/Thr protein kinase RdoA (MazF antagonist)